MYDIYPHLTDENTDTISWSVKGEHYSVPVSIVGQNESEMFWKF